MLAFPYYGHIFYPKTNSQIEIVDPTNIQKVNIDISGMTCRSCEEHVNYSVNELDGIISINSSSENGNSSVEFDKSKTNIEDIESAINSTGYKVINIEMKLNED